MHDGWKLIAASAAVLGLGLPTIAQEGEQPSEPEDSEQSGDQGLEETGEQIAEQIEPQRTSFWKGWGGNVALGLNGASGNTERLNLRGEINGTRDTEFMTTSATALYTYATDDGEASESRFFTGLRNDWKIQESRWRVFGEGSLEFDDFQDWDYRVAAAGGMGYEFIDNEKTTLLGRVGLGLSREIGGEDNSIRPEGLLGADFSHQLTERQKLTADATLYPDLSETGEFRFVGNAAWEMLIDPEVNMSLRLGIEDRYDSTPGGDNKKNDIAYFAMLVWEF